MTMKLRYSPTSPYVRKVLVTAIETGQAGAIERVPADTADPNDPLGKVNPLAKVPALELEDGRLLVDSPVICEYLDSLHDGPRLFPTGGEPRWQALLQQALADGILDAAVLCVMEGRRPEEKRWQGWLDKQMLKVRRTLDYLESHAEDLTGGGLTIGQITVGCALGYIDFRFAGEEWRGGHPRLAAWYEGFAKRPSMQETRPPQG
jgi:glutathione S-transferase